MAQPSGTPSPKTIRLVHASTDIDDWHNRLTYTDSRPPRPLNTIDNIAIALDHAPEWRGVFVYDIFHCRYRILEVPPWGGPRNRYISDEDYRRVWKWLSKEGIHAQLSVVTEGVRSACHNTEFNPLTDYLDSLEWDGVKRTYNWLSYFLGAPDNHYTQAVGEKWLISAVARAYRPGCKVDSCLVLEGGQGIGKSTALNILAGDDYFTDYMHGKLNETEAAILLSGAWIVEFSELEGLTSKSSRSETVKGFLSRRIDRYRPKYGKDPQAFNRTCVFAATTNNLVYLEDSTGQRRFWPVKCGNKILTGQLRNERDMLWAEAVHMFKDNHVWHLDEHEERWAAREQALRHESDPKTDQIDQYISKRDVIVITDMMRDGMEYEPGKINQFNKMWISDYLQKIGWMPSKVGGQRVYRRPTPLPKTKNQGHKPRIARF